MTDTDKQAAYVSALAFFMSTVLTGWFIHSYGGYLSKQTMLLSGSIAGGKWAIQIILGWCVLGEKRWPYIRQLAMTCLVGSLALVPCAIFSGGAKFFFGSLLVSILMMTANIFIRLKQIGLSRRWPALWLVLLAIAVGLQLTVVFHFI